LDLCRVSLWYVCNVALYIWCGATQGVLELVVFVMRVIGLKTIFLLPLDLSPPVALALLDSIVYTPTLSTT
jgi:hypothetical protein